MVSHEELGTIQERMKKLDSHNQSAFLRKIAVDGYAINVDLAPVKELISLQRQCVNNLTQIAKQAQAHNVYQTEIMKLQKGYAELWEQYSELLKTSCKTCYAVSVYRTSGQAQTARKPAQTATKTHR